MLTVHHLQRSQSERIVWLCEELTIPYELRVYKRDSETYMSPPELQALHPAKAAPVIQDGLVTLGESGAVVEYILTKYGEGKLSIPPGANNYADYLYFLHFANGYFQPAVLRMGLTTRAGIPADSRSAIFTKRSFNNALQILEDRLQKWPWLAGSEFTAADIMVVVSLTTMRLFAPYRLEGRDAILEYLQRVSQREGYRQARSKSDPGFEPMIAP